VSGRCSMPRSLLRLRTSGDPKRNNRLLCAPDGASILIHALHAARETNTTHSLSFHRPKTRREDQGGTKRQRERWEGSEPFSILEDKPAHCGSLLEQSYCLDCIGYSREPQSFPPIHQSFLKSANETRRTK
jgi:hypothetical protein